MSLQISTWTNPEYPEEGIVDARDYANGVMATFHFNPGVNTREQAEAQARLFVAALELAKRVTDLEGGAV